MAPVLSSLEDIVLAQFHTIQCRQLRLSIAKYLEDATTEFANSTDGLCTALKCFRIGTGSRRVHAFSRAVPAIEDGEGNLYPDAIALANAWVQHFANTEGGNAVEASAIADIVFCERDRITRDGYSGPLADLPTRQQIETALRKTKRRSAPGPDGVAADILILTRTWSSIQIAALALKSALTMQAPLQSRGGRLFHLYRGKGPQTEMDKYRSILLADCVGKVSSRTYRTAHTPFIAAAMQD